jgi:excinuclease ABC subunit B
MAEELTEYLQDAGFRVRYIHSDITSLDRIEIIQDLRAAKFDCLVGVNLLREGLDLPEVSLVIVLDADKEGFLRSTTSLIQVAGRAARNLAGEVIMYADNITNSIKSAIKECNRRRKIQVKHNETHNIQPRSIKRAVYQIIEHKNKSYKELSQDKILKKTFRNKKEQIKHLAEKMMESARNLEFEKAAIIRDYIKELKQKTKKT